VVEIHHVYPEEGPDRPKAARVRIVLARDRAELVAAERELLLQAGLTCIVLVALIGFLSWTAVNRGLEPAQRFAAAVDALDVQHLPDSLDVPDLPIELRPVAEKTNALVRRVDAALRRERRTTADIAHELRTPISEILTASEVALRDTRDPEAARRALAVAREVAWRMARSVATLLKLARLEMGAEHFERERVELGALVEEGFRSLAPLAHERSLRAENLVRAQDSVLGDREVLRIVVSNLLANAFAYTPVAGRVACRIENRNDRWHLIVENDAGGLVPEDLALLAEPFWRKDRARSDRSRSGLGLALSSALAQRSGLELTFELAEGRFRAILAGDDHGAGGLPGESGSPASTSVRTPAGRSLADVSPRSLG
jgi:signal transduction histidine kinase